MTRTMSGARLGRAIYLFFGLCAATSQAATITVNSLADDVFPDAVGAIFDSNGAPVVLASPKCTLRMAIASANLDVAVGGLTNGCTAGSGPDAIVFAAALNLTTTPGTITLADKGMSEAPATYSPPPILASALVVSRPLTITGPGSASLTIDGNIAGNSGRRPMHVSDGDQNADMLFLVSGLRFLRGRAIEQGAGCVFSTESTTISDVIFESCESVGGPTQQGFGGALGVGNLAAGTVRPDVTLTNSTFVANRSTRGSNTTVLPTAGAAFFGSGTRKVGRVTISNSRFIGNTAESVGALLVRDASAATGDAVSIVDSQFLSNAATGTTTFFNGGRFGGFDINTVTGNVTLNDVASVGNTAAVERAGFSVLTVSGTTTITNGTVVGNVAFGGRIGGFEVLTDNFDQATGNCLGTSKNPVIVTGTSVQSNFAMTNTGGFRVQCSGTVSIANSDISNNNVFGSTVAGSGGNSAGQINTNLAVSMSNVSVQNNRTDAGVVDGGSGVLTVQDNTSFDGARLLFLFNHVDRNEAGLTLRASGAGRNFTLVDSAFAYNIANQGTSALFLDSTGNYAVKNSTFSGNSAGGGGAVLVNMNAAAGSNAVLFENVTSARHAGANLALQFEAVGAPLTPSGTVTIKNTILGTGQAKAASAQLPTIAGVNYAVSNSLIEIATSGVPAGICGTNGNKCNLDSRLENLALNGTTTTFTQALRPGSPALDAGAPTTLTNDQRGAGFPRVIGTAVDIGAFESPALPALCTLDVDGNGSVDPLTDGLIVIRAMLGMTGTAVTTDSLGAGATRNTWQSIQPYLNGSCGATFAP